MSFVVQVQGVSLWAGVQPAGYPEAREASARPLAGRIPRDLQRFYRRRAHQEGPPNQAQRGEAHSLKGLCHESNNFFEGHKSQISAYFLYMRQ